MPAAAPQITPQSAEALSALGGAVRQRRKALGISAVAAAEAAGISRPTLHRIEKGEPAVTMGATMQVLVVLGLALVVEPEDEPGTAATAPRPGWLPARVRIADYPWLRQLAWQVQGAQELTPREALGIYERNWRHVDAQALTTAEQDLIDALRLALGDAPGGAAVV
ncbi:helix-turn-helix domain-containing protein [Pseudorhodoferax sp. Leaf267]|uniref:helix-turn-helix domain-containing protein n=1 Tax=Pseudorhodoferax sp. Leaf267 TaxID=1736316 RepID=UPI0006F3EB2A|nr:helix-turn-helix domain-containing protein [Pseudorhodoferax sp. Leaf267]KQP12139.1 XRE family transcriptional regulator [Pseudorhodoferax sp. Leaf267]